MDCNPPCSSLHGIPQQEYWSGRQEYQARTLHCLLQWSFLTQGPNLGLLHCKWILYHLSYLGISKTNIRKRELSKECEQTAQMEQQKGPLQGTAQGEAGTSGYSSRKGRR